MRCCSWLRSSMSTTSPSPVTRWMRPLRGFSTAPTSRWPAQTGTGRASRAKMADTEAAEMQDQTEEVSMRKVVASELVSLDGVMESPEKWSFRFHNDEMAEANEAGMAQADAMLLGRGTFQGVASYLPFQNSAAQPL